VAPSRRRRRRSVTPRPAAARRSPEQGRSIRVAP
jgi:hypothetical protein